MTTFKQIGGAALLALTIAGGGLATVFAGAASADTDASNASATSTTQEAGYNLGNTNLIETHAATVVKAHEAGAILGLNAGPVPPLAVQRRHPPARRTSFETAGGAIKAHQAGTISGLNGGGLMPQQRRAIEQRRLQEQRRLRQQQAGPASFTTSKNTVTITL
jgi:hypothetical protein